jgi:predicted DNA-binding transcriptional regulator YafY
MAKGANQKLKILYLMRILLEKTDENHLLTIAEMIDHLAAYQITAERKSLYDDIEALRQFGLDIEKTSGKNCGYYVASRPFELPELKLLVDAVQSSKFITTKKSNDLIKKVEGLTSQHEARQLQRQVYVANRIKTMNESIYYNIDSIHSAISQGKKITFKYFEWKVMFSGQERFKKQYRRDGQNYKISPWSLTWDNEFYYLIGYDSDAAMIKHYRVDKMSNIEITNDRRDGQKHFEQFDMGLYTKCHFGMFSGSEEAVRLRFTNDLIGVVLDRFGRDIFINNEDDEHFTVQVKVAVSPQFLSWVFGFGNKVKLLSPERVVAAFRQQAKETMELYS